MNRAWAASCGAEWPGARCRAAGCTIMHAEPKNQPKKSVGRKSCRAKRTTGGERRAISHVGICSSRQPVLRRRCPGRGCGERARGPQAPAVAAKLEAPKLDAPKLDSPRREALETLTAAEADMLEAIVARLIPTDENGPGATEARAAHYIDRALVGPLRGSRAAYAAGLAALDDYAQSAKGAPFAKLVGAGPGRGADRHGEERRDRLHAECRRRSSIWCARTRSRARSAIPTMAAMRISSAGT